ncbi:helix-turn-helix domain-containing protein, partial [Streptomyces sp. H-KF8]|uniref:helix-turn-helix domain-containing protein n=1 Tax=Streptomyces sp. H-KF8 TaxID=1727216 RepID=UPI0018FED5E8
MTIKHIAMVLDAEGLDGPEKLLLIAYCNRTDDHGYCWPASKRLADDCGTSIATVKRVKAKLIKKKLIASQRRLDPRTGEPTPDAREPRTLGCDEAPAHQLRRQRHRANHVRRQRAFADQEEEGPKSAA